MGEAYNGATRDWAIVDVPPGTTRVKMNGIGGAAEEVTWQRYNGVRRAKFIPEADGYDREEIVERVEERGLDKGRRFVGMKPKTDTMWTEITKDLVIKEAIERLGYDYEETEFFFYVMEYLRYVSRGLLVFLRSSFFLPSPLLSLTSLTSSPLTGRRPSPRRNFRGAPPRASRPHPRNRVGTPTRARP